MKRGLAPFQQECSPTVTVIPVDAEFVEVSLYGIWVAESKEAHEGMFLTVLGDFPSETLRERAECFIYRLWQMSESWLSFSNGKILSIKAEESTA